MLRRVSLLLLASGLLVILLLPVVWPALAKVSVIYAEVNVGYMPVKHLQKIADECLNGKDLRTVDRVDYEMCLFRKIPALKDVQMYFWGGKLNIKFYLPSVVFGLRTSSGKILYYASDGLLYPAKWFSYPIEVQVFDVGSKIGETAKVVSEFLNVRECKLLLQKHVAFRVDAYQDGQVMLWFKRENRVRKFIFSLDTADTGCRTALEHWSEIEELNYGIVDLTHGGIIVVKDD